MFCWFQGLPNKQTLKFCWILLLLDSKMIKKFINRGNCAAGAKKEYPKDARKVDWITENILNLYILYLLHVVSFNTELVLHTSKFHTHRTNCIHCVNTILFYLRDLSIHRFWYLQRLLESIPCDTEGQLYFLFLVFKIIAVALFLITKKKILHRA